MFEVTNSGDKKYRGKIKAFPASSNCVSSFHPPDSQSETRSLGYNSPAQTPVFPKRNFNQPFNSKTQDIQTNQDTKLHDPFYATCVWNGIVNYFKKNIELKKHRFRLKVYDGCFSGSEAVNIVYKYLCSERSQFGNKIITREKATKVCQLMMQLIIIQSVHEGQKLFEDSSAKLYRLARSPDNNIIDNNIVHANSCTGEQRNNSLDGEQIENQMLTPPAKKHRISTDFSADSPNSLNGSVISNRGALTEQLNSGNLVERLNRENLMEGPNRQFTRPSEYLTPWKQERLNRENLMEAPNRQFTRPSEYLTPWKQERLNRENLMEAPNRQFTRPSEYLTPWRHCSAECIQLVPGLHAVPEHTIVTRRSSFPDSGFSINDDPNSSFVETKEDEVIRETALSCLLSLIELPFLDGIANVASRPKSSQSNANRPVFGFTNFYFRRFESSYSLYCCINDKSKDFWWQSAMDCLELLPCGQDIYDRATSVDGGLKSQKLQLFLLLAERYQSQVTPLWPEVYSDLHVQLYRLLMKGQFVNAVRAFQLSLVILDEETKDRMKKLLAFMKCASDEHEIKLSNQMSNQSVVESFFSPAIIKNQILTPHQSSLLITFILDHLDLMWTLPTDVLNIVKARMNDGSDAIGQSFCERITPGEYERQTVDETEKALVDLMNFTLDSTQLSLKDKKRRLKQLAKHHSTIYSKYFADMV